MPRKDDGAPLDQGKALAGVLALLVAEREERVNGSDGKNAPKTEVLLATAGLTAAEIAQLTGKSLEAVRKTIQRGRK